MFAGVMSLISNYKKASMVIGVVALLSGGILGFNLMKNNYIDRGYQKAKSEYNLMLINQMNIATSEYSKKLITMRDNYNQQVLREQARGNNNTVIDTQVDKTIEYIEREVYVKAECNIVDDNIVSMFNDSITRVNTSKQDR